MEPLPDAVKEFIRAAPVCRIASVRASGSPHAIPVCPAFDGDSTVYIDVAIAGVTAKALVANPEAVALFDQYYDDWSKLQAVALRCRAEPVEGDELERAWVLFGEKFPQGAAIGWSPRLTLALRLRGWTEWGITAALAYDSE